MGFQECLACLLPPGTVATFGRAAALCIRFGAHLALVVVAAAGGHESAAAGMGAGAERSGRDGFSCRFVKKHIAKQATVYAARQGSGTGRAGIGGPAIAESSSGRCVKWCLLSAYPRVITAHSERKIAELYRKLVRRRIR